MKIDLSCPVELNSLVLNEETQTAELTFFNLSKQAITAMKYTLVIFNENGEEIERTPAELEGITFNPQESFEAVIAAENASGADVIFNEITFCDETVFVPSGEMTEFSYEEISDTELARIKRAGAPDGCCYAKKENDYWLCVCGRPNLPTSESCIKCDRPKEDVLKNFVSEESVALTILNKEDNDAAVLAEEKAAQKEKTLKTIKKSGIIAVIIAAVLIIGFFAFKFIVTSIGDSSAKAGDYEKAYSMYKLAGSDKIDKIADRIYGNTVTNVNTFDLTAQDDENIYFTDLAGHIYKQNKATGEKTVLKEASALYLNASGGWLYYVNLEDENKIYKISPDGKTDEVVYDGPVYAIFTVFNDVYFIADRIDTDEDTAKDSTEDSEIKSQIPIYVLKSGATEPELILDAEAYAFSIYKDKIYYTDSADEFKLKAMKLSGGDSETITETPVYDFAIRDNKIYYLDYENYSLESADLKGKHLETLIDDAMVTTFGISDDTIYYTDYNQQGVLLKKEIGKDAVVEAESVSVVNISEGTVYYASYDGSFYISKPDKSGYEPIEIPSEESPEATEENADEAPSETSEATAETEPTETAVTSEPAA